MLAQGGLFFPAARQALLMLDVAEKKVLPSAPRPAVKTFVEHSDAAESSGHECPPLPEPWSGNEGGDDGAELPEEDAAAFLTTLEEQDSDEEDRTHISAAVIEDKVGTGKRRARQQ